jgi:hypothetical protein
VRLVLRSSHRERRRKTPGSKFAGGHRIRVPPVPIPNTEVKPDTADGTAWETVWESRSLPALFLNARGASASRAFVCMPAAGHRSTQFPMRHGLRLLGRLARSAAVWESRSLPALFLNIPQRPRSVSFAGVRLYGVGALIKARWRLPPRRAQRACVRLRTPLRFARTFPTPGGRRLSPRRPRLDPDIGNTVALLCSNEASFITGQLIAVDGGAGLMNPALPLAIQQPELQPA